MAKMESESIEKPTSKAELAIAVEGVSKQIGDHLILDGVHLNVPPSKIFGISGPNGSGKSMLLRVICGLVRPTRGRVWVSGREIGKDVEFPGETGVLIETPGFLPHYSGSRNLQLLAMIRNRISREDIADTIRLVGLDPNEPKPVRTYSTGMRQRLGIAQAIMENPRLLLLDEPTNGLDREGIKDVHRLLKELRADGVTILLTSHSREEIDELCDAEFVMENGRLSSIHISPNRS
jgi:ABC-2 type transport system ATP-binding protein